eukprot:220495-Pyramimonas_sp.AAC.1
MGVGRSPRGRVPPFGFCNKKYKMILICGGQWALRETQRMKSTKYCTAPSESQLHHRGCQQSVPIP